MLGVHELGCLLEQPGRAPPAISLSNGIRATIASTSNGLGLATIRSAAFDGSAPPPTYGFVNCSKGPVVGFLHN